MNNLFKSIKTIYQAYKRKYEIMKYDDFSIENYFRKQGAEIGYNNRIMIRSLGGTAHFVKIGNHCTIANDVLLLTHDGGGWIFTDERASLQKFGSIRILDNCFIGIRTTIMPNVTIGPNSIVGACSVVTKNVAPKVVVAGNPAREICSIYKYREKLYKIWDMQKPEGYLKDLKDGVIYNPRRISEAKKRDAALLVEHLKYLFSNT